MKTLYSKGCKCKPRCTLYVTVWLGGKPMVFDDPHECHSCHRRFKDRLGQAASGIYSCGLEDCFAVHLKWSAEATKNSPACQKYFKLVRKIKEKR